jgi:predicted GNAT family acetyltransferase
MPAWNVNVDEGAAPSLGSFAPSFGESLKASVQNTFNENVSTLGYDYLQNQSANNGPKLDKPEAERMVKEAGAKLTIPEDGYTKEALSQLIQRQQDQMTRQSVMDRTPWSWLGSPTRGAAMLLTGLTDPLNVASAFIPVVGEARAASALARATGAARFGTRAAIGAAEGAVGAAVLEPAVYGFHQGLQDDYHMVDSLMNIGFGGLLGGGLHSVGGTVADALHTGPDRFSRFAGLDAEQTGRVMEFERLTRKGEKPNSDTWTSAMRQAAGLETPPASRVMEFVSPELREATLRTAVADMVQGRTPDVDAIVAYQPPRIGMQTFDAMPDGVQIGASKVADKQGREFDITITKEMLGAEKNAPSVNVSATFDGGRRGRIDFAVQSDGTLAAENTMVANAFRGAGLAEVMYRAAKELGFEIVPGRKQTEAGDKMVAALQAKGVIGIARDADTSRAAVAVQSTAERQQKPEAAMLGSPESSKAAETRVAEAPKDHAIEAAKVELTDAMSRLNELQKNLELGGAAPEKLAHITEGLKAFDEAIKDAANIGKAIIQNAICGLRS